MEKKILYFDCSSGISGDMTLGALLGLTKDKEGFLRELEKLELEGYRITFETVVRNAVTANHVNVVLTQQESGEHGHDHVHGDGQGHSHGHTHEEEHSHGHVQEEGHSHTHEHSHAHRSYRDIRAMIEDSRLADEVKELALRIFHRVAKAEAKVHGKAVDEVQFHEVGAVDSIVDIVGCAILVCQLKPDLICASVVQEGCGFIHCQHGLLAVPVPAVSEIFADAGIVMRQTQIETELVTPTGAAIIAELTAGYGGTTGASMPQMRLEKVGWGAGTKVLPIPNVLKVFAGSAQTEAAADIYDRDTVAVLETNLDDATGEMLGYAMERLLQAGALDVFYTPVFMKKNRPAYRLSVIARCEDEETMAGLMFSHTTTIGIRRRVEHRYTLKREKDVVQTPFGALEVKCVRTAEGIRRYPEYESAVKLAETSHHSLWEIYQSYEHVGKMVSESV